MSDLRNAQVWVAVTITDGRVADLEVLDCAPRWTPVAGQRFFAANVNGGDSTDVTPLEELEPEAVVHGSGYAGGNDVLVPAAEIGDTSIPADLLAAARVIYDDAGLDGAGLVGLWIENGLDNLYDIARDDGLL